MSRPAHFSVEALECLRWLHINLIQSRGASLSEEQLQQLALAVGDDAVRVCVMWAAVDGARVHTRRRVAIASSILPRQRRRDAAAVPGSPRACDDASQL
jgi:hypothetical protein